MGARVYRINEFIGLDQSKTENAISPSYSPNAENIDTSNGGLAVAKGYVKHIPTAIPGVGEIRRLAVFANSSGGQFIAVAGNSIYAFCLGEWVNVYTYDTPITKGEFSFVQANIGGVEYMLIASGEHQLVKYNGAAASLFGSAEGQSDIAAQYMALYRSRLFLAGDALHPNRLYWSQLPGGDRTIESFAPVSASPSVEGGHTEVGDSAADPIIGITALQNQILIFKKYSLYRLIGDRPENFTVERVDSSFSRCAHTAIVTLGESLFFMGSEGLNMFNGVLAMPSADARRISGVLKRFSTQKTRAAICKHKLYFTLHNDYEDVIVEYDLERRAYMLRTGFDVTDICAWEGELYLVNSNRFICRFGEGLLYDTQPIRAFWRTPYTDLYDKSGIKALRQLSFCAETEREGSAVVLVVKVGKNLQTHRVLADSEGVTEVPLYNEGRAFSMEFSNEAGGHFLINSGLELKYDYRERVS